MDTLRLAAAVVLLSPYIPMLFMGEEYGEDTPFFFFTDYQEPVTSKGQVEGRRQQFAAFGFEGEVPDPQEPELFEQSKLHWEKRFLAVHGALLDWHRDLIKLRRTHPLLSDLSKRFLRADVLGPAGLSVYRYSADGGRHLVCLYNFSHSETLSVSLGYAAVKEGVWRQLLGSDAGSDVPAGGVVRLLPQGVAVYELNPSPGSPAPVAE
jgi:maltooligosyltrehalose trehalohydrolase